MKKLIGIFNTKINTPDEIYQKVKEVLENRNKKNLINLRKVANDDIHKKFKNIA